MDRVLADVAIVIAVAVLVGFYVSWRATRLDRLHARAEAARATLDAALARRGAVALELAASGLLDPATSLLIAGAAHDARAAGQVESVAAVGGEAQPRELAESDLSRALRAAFGQPGFRESLTGKGGADELLAEIEGAGHQVFLARKFYNDAVAATLRGTPTASRAAAAPRRGGAGTGVLRDRRRAAGRWRRQRRRGHAPPDRLIVPKRRNGCRVAPPARMRGVPGAPGWQRATWSESRPGWRNRPHTRHDMSAAGRLAATCRARDPGSGHWAAPTAANIMEATGMAHRGAPRVQRRIRQPPRS